MENSADILKTSIILASYVFSYLEIEIKFYKQNKNRQTVYSGF